MAFKRPPQTDQPVFLPKDSDAESARPNQNQAD